MGPRRIAAAYDKPTLACDAKGLQDHSVTLRHVVHSAGSLCFSHSKRVQRKLVIAVQFWV
jgi:hypothetical protein